MYDWVREQYVNAKLAADRQRGLQWIWSIKPGDVLKSRAGTLRVVRRVSLSRGRIFVYFTIRHCSWTHRCYTLLERNDLIQCGYTRVNARVSLRKRIDRAIEKEFDVREPKEIVLDCCKVKGIS